MCPFFINTDMKHLLISLALLGSGLSFAQERKEISIMCHNTEAIFNELVNRYKEAPVAYGSGPDQTVGVMSLWNNQQTGTWTIVMTYPDKSCIVMDGEKLNVKPMVIKNGTDI